MQKTFSFFILLFTAALTGCSGKMPAPDAVTPEARPTVTLVHATPGTITRTVTLSATTAYLRKSVVAAPVAGYVISDNVQTGMRVGAGAVLYRLQSKEQNALAGTLDAADSAPIPVRAGRGGVVVSVEQQPGCYVTDGAVLCTIAETGSLVFVVDVPYAQRRLACPGTEFTMELPDGTRFVATVGTPLADMNTTDQTEHVVAYVRCGFQPEGLRAKAIFNVGKPGRGHLLLPRTALQSDEALTSHWVMCLTGAGTVRRVPVEVVTTDDERVEITAIGLSPADRIVADGAYGLEDGQRVVVAGKEVIR